MTSRRTDSVFAAMADRGLDALVLGRQDNTTWATGMHRLWTAGTRPFGAGCVLVAATGGVHLLSSWDDAIPDEVPFEHLYGITWNPAVMGGHMAAIDGLAESRRIGVDALSPGFARAAARFASEAALVPAHDLLWTVRRVKGDDDIAAVRVACAAAGKGWAAVAEALQLWGGADAGPAAAELRGSALEAVALGRAMIPSSGVRVERIGGITTVDVGVLVDDWEGGLGRTLDRAGDPRGGRIEERVAALVAGCTDGASGAELAASGGDDHDWTVRGLGMGFEPPVIRSGLGESETLEPGMIVSVEARARADHRDGPAHHREIVLVTDAGPELLS